MCDSKNGVRRWRRRSRQRKKRKKWKKWTGNKVKKTKSSRRRRGIKTAHCAPRTHRRNFVFLALLAQHNGVSRTRRDHELSRFFTRYNILHIIVFVVLFVGRFWSCLPFASSPSVQTHNLMGFNSCALRTTEFMKIFGFGALRLRVLAFSYINSRPNRVRLCVCITLLLLNSIRIRCAAVSHISWRPMRHTPQNEIHNTHTEWERWSGEGEREGESLSPVNDSLLVCQKKLKPKRTARKTNKK